jgi:MFS family permease
MVKQPRFFYGWVIVGIVIVNMVLIYGIRHSFSVFLPSILDEFGWSRGSTAVMLSMNIFVYGLLAPVAGGLGDRWKPGRVMPIGISILGLTTAGCAFAHELWHFYLLFGVLVPVGMAFCGWPLLGPTLINWFAKRRGLVTGLGQMGGGLSFAYGMLIAFIISQLGWRYTYFVLAGIIFALLLPIHFLFFHYRQENKGLQAYGVTEEPSDAKGSVAELTDIANPMSDSWTLGQAMKTYQLWLLMLSNFLYWGIAVYLVLAHQVQFAEDMGYSSLFAASVFALFGFSVAAGQLSGFISDWIGREMTITFATILAIGALVALISVGDTSQPWLLYVYAVCFGYGAGLQTPTIFASMADIFHGRHFGTIAGLLLTGMGMGSAIGPWLGGYIYDVSGSYIGAFILCMLCLGLACIAIWVAAPRNAGRIRNRQMQVPII